MSYVGGKSRGFQHIISILNDPKYDDMEYYEPFCGYCHITRRVINKKSITINDYNGLLVCLLNGIKQNLPYPQITRERYYQLKNQHYTINWERAIAGFCYSYNGKLWGGYVLDNSNTPSYKKTQKLMVYHKQRQNYYEKLKQNKSFMNSSLKSKSYEEFNPIGALIYCDPPYRNTTSYHKKSVGDFDHDKFWDWVRKLSQNNIVYVSEYTAPNDFICVAEQPKKSTLSGKRISKIEKLFQYDSGCKKQQTS
jgi:DNA adenine methylase